MPKKIAIHFSSAVMNHFYKIDSDGELKANIAKFKDMLKYPLAKNFILSADVCKSGYFTFQSQDFELLRSFEFCYELPLDMPKAYGKWLALQNQTIDELVVVMSSSEAQLYNLHSSSYTSFRTRPYITGTLNNKDAKKLNTFLKKLNAPHDPTHLLNQAFQYSKPEDYLSYSSKVSNFAITPATLRKKIPPMVVNISNALGFKSICNDIYFAKLTVSAARSR